MSAFLLELCQGFSFIARQKRMSIGADDYDLDLLFFHRPLRGLVVIELELGRFDARDKGRWGSNCAGSKSTNASRTRTRRWG